MPDGPPLALAGVSKRYGEVVALRDVSFEIGSGSAVGYLGPNGAGKTTTLKLLAGLTRAERGTVRVDGLDPFRDRRRALRRLGVLVETPGILPYVRGDDLLDHMAQVKGVGAAGRATEVQRAASAMGVASSLPRPLGALSTGVLRRILLAGALLGEPEALLLDEPTLGLDPAARADLRATLRGLARSGRTLLLSTHLLEDVEEVCDRVLFLREGKLAGDEAVHAPPEEGTGDHPRRLRVGTASDIDARKVGALLAGHAEVEARSPRELMVLFSGGAPVQAEILRRLVEGEVPVVSAELIGSDLAERYLARVGREEAT